MICAILAGSDADVGTSDLAPEEDLHKGFAPSDIQQPEEELAASEDGIEQAVSASQDWSRIIRRPRKRKGHIIVDLCTAAGWKACSYVLLITARFKVAVDAQLVSLHRPCQKPYCDLSSCLHNPLSRICQMQVPLKIHIRLEHCYSRQLPKERGINGWDPKDIGLSRR